MFGCKGLSTSSPKNNFTSKMHTHSFSFKDSNTHYDWLSKRNQNSLKKVTGLTWTRIIFNILWLQKVHPFSLTIMHQIFWKVLVRPHCVSDPEHGNQDIFQMTFPFKMKHVPGYHMWYLAKGSAVHKKCNEQSLKDQNLMTFTLFNII